MGVSVPQGSPTRTVVVGRYMLEVGAPPGTSISLSAEPEQGDPQPLARALKQGRADGKQKNAGVGSVADAVDDASAATAGAERAVALFRGLAEGKVLDPRQLSGEIDTLLDLVERLDREGRWREALRLARALSGVLALLMRWADLVRSLNIALRAAQKLDDASEVARACHELGTLQLAAEDPAAAERALGEAREIRHRLGDSRGLAATDRNLQVLCRQLRQLVRDGRLVQKRGVLRSVWRVKVVLVVAVAMLSAAGLASAVVDGGNSVAPLAVCDNGRDDDRDRFVDGDDPGCADGSEAPVNERPARECDNGKDNDGDKLVDLKDPGCASATDNDESNVLATACADGSDNDGDKLRDLKDPGCASATDNDESNVLATACADGSDNDGDKLETSKIRVARQRRTTTRATVPPTACADGSDNDGDQLVDLKDPVARPRPTTTRATWLGDGLRGWQRQRRRQARRPQRSRLHVSDRRRREQRGARRPARMAATTTATSS